MPISIFNLQMKSEYAANVVGYRTAYSSAESTDTSTKESSAPRLKGTSRGAHRGTNNCAFCR